MSRQCGDGLGLTPSRSTIVETPHAFHKTTDQ